MTEAKTLYQNVILENAKSPRNLGPLASATHEATLLNPLCGDRVTLRLEVHEGLVRAAKFEARGCMIARASASLMTEAIIGQTVQDALAHVNALDALLSDASPSESDAGALEPFRGAREFPARKACVLLAWRALEKAVD